MNRRGFTIIELLVIIVVISILAGISVVGYGAWRERTATKEVESNLQQYVNYLESKKNFDNGYPTTIPDEYTPSPGVVLQMVQSPPGQYCINVYHKTKTTIQKSVSSLNKNTIRNYLCTGATSGRVAGGSLPQVEKNTNILPDFDSWILTGTASYSSSTKELLLGTNGSATSPLIRVEGTTAAYLNGMFYASVQSTNGSVQPDGAWHSGSAYFSADGTTPATNTGGFTGNGCAKKVSLNTWAASLNGNCVYALGNNVSYLRLFLYSAASGYSSSDLKIRQASLILN